MKPKILIVDDYVEHANNLNEILLAHDYNSEPVFSAEEALEKVAKKKYHLILLDNKLPGMDGLEFVRVLRDNNNNTPVIMYSAFGDSHLGSEAAKLGVHDFIPKGDDLGQLYDVIETAIQKHEILSRQKFDVQYFRQKYNFVGVSKAIQELLSKAVDMAKTDARILITGETGVGKNLLAEIIHKEGNRSEKPFVWLDCTTIPETLLESELFGYERGAFTGADKKHMGRLSYADKGTLLIDQIDDMSPQMQAKFLRFIETGEFEPLGGNVKQKIDLRIISTALNDLKQKIKENTFREDLYYRIAQVELNIPPLRERKEDIIYLAQHFARNYSIKYKKPLIEFSQEALNLMVNYDWPGNVRQLQFLTERLIIFKKYGSIVEKDLDVLRTDETIPAAAGEIKSLKKAKIDFEKEYILRALIMNEWNVNQTAKMLAIDRTNLYKKIQFHQISLDKQDFHKK